MKTTYRFETLRPGLTNYGYNKLYVETFVGAMNDRDFVRHQTERDANGEFLAPATQVWSYGVPPRHFDGRVTTRRTSWVFARKETGMPEGAVAMVYFITESAPIGFLTKEA